ncbi:hypothetical protein [Aeromonas caviae]|uniref:hypothetical protein n=1 Tax=Aeromonas caviae TaxID=648 RepID=UPI0004DB15FD|nr:hypothetical protein [Aeromonas caviae]KEP91390.1 hypothetical protein DA11_07150 [Aeromonas caviae]
MGDTTATAAPTVVITEDTDNDGTIEPHRDQRYRGRAGHAAGRCGGGGCADRQRPGADHPDPGQIDGKFLTFEYPRPADGGSIEVKATLTDKAGNVSPEGQDSAVMGDTTATAAPTVVITEDTDTTAPSTAPRSAVPWACRSRCRPVRWRGMSDRQRPGADHPDPGPD